MEPGCLPFRDLPHSTRLFADFTSDFERVQPFFARPPQDWTNLPKRKSEYPAARRAQVASILERQNRGWGCSQQVSKNIERLRNGAAAIVTGQQVALFGGPAFSIYKAVSAVRLAQELTARGSECVPVFWLATEDHDFAEISNALLRSPAGEAARVALGSTAAEGTPVGRIRLGAQITSALNEVEKTLGAGEMSSLLRECYRPEETFGGAFARLFAKLFGEFGLILLDPADRELHELAAPLFCKAAEGARELTSALLERGEQLERAGYHQQVKVTNSSTLLFMEQKQIRTPIKKVNGNFGASAERFSSQELLRAIQAEPQRFTGNALLRPVVQDFLLPTGAYIGGPAEIAYFAQCDVIYKKLLGETTPIRPRMSATLVDARDERLLRQYQLGFPQLLAAHARLGELLAAKRVPKNLNRELENAGETVKVKLEELKRSLATTDPSMAAAAETAIRKMNYQLQHLRGKVARAELRRNSELAEHAQALNASLLPNGELQERQFAGVSYLARSGRELLPRLIKAASPDCIGHQLIPL